LLLQIQPRSRNANIPPGPVLGGKVNPVEACKELQKVFGDDFPVPEKDDTGQARGPAIIASSHAA
jgi:hypothetical protein